MNPKLSISICIALLAGLNGCATVFSGNGENLNFQSQPPGAIYEYGSYNGTTPNTVAVSRGALASTAVFKKAGYETKTVPVSTSIRGVTWVNLLFPPGFIIDFVSGNAYTVDEKNINGYLTPIPAAAASAQIAPQPLGTQPSASTSTSGMRPR